MSSQEKRASIGVPGSTFISSLLAAYFAGSIGLLGRLLDVTPAPEVALTALEVLA